MPIRPQPLHARPLLDSLPIGRDAASVRIRLEAMERVMEGLFTIPGTNRKVGMDVLLDLVPIVGTTIASMMVSEFSRMVRFADATGPAGANKPSRLLQRISP